MNDHNYPVLLFTNDENADLVYYEICKEDEPEDCLRALARDIKVLRPDLPVGPLELHAWSCVWEDRASTKDINRKIVLDKGIAPGKSLRDLYCGDMEIKKFTQAEIFNQKIDKLCKDQYQTQLDMDALIYQAQSIMEKYSEDIFPTKQQCPDNKKSEEIKKQSTTISNLRELFHRLVQSSFYDEVRGKVKETSYESNPIKVSTSLSLVETPPKMISNTETETGVTTGIKVANLPEEIPNKGTKKVDDVQKKEGMAALTVIGAGLLVVGSLGLIFSAGGIVAKKVTLHLLNNKIGQSGLDLTFVSKLPDTDAKDDLDNLFTSHKKNIEEAGFDIQKLKALKNSIDTKVFPYDENMRKFKDLLNKYKEGKLTTSDIDEMIDMKAKLREAGFKPTGILDIHPELNKNVDMVSEKIASDTKYILSANTLKENGIKSVDVADGALTSSAKAFKNKNLAKTAGASAGLLIGGIASVVVAEYALTQPAGSNPLTCADSLLIQELAPIEFQLDALREIYKIRGLQLIDAIFRENTGGY